MKKTAIFLLCLIPFFSFAQKVKYGKVSKADLSMKNYPKDPDAGAVFLYKYGMVDIRRVSNELKTIYEYHNRIMIFSESAFDLAEAEITYRTGNVSEEISGIKGVTHYLDSDGNVTSVKMDNSGVFRKKIDKDWSSVSFTLPKVAVGCIIEYKYRITTDDLLFLRPYYFQASYPVKQCRYITRIPQNFRYVIYSKGDHPMTEVKTEGYSENVSQTMARMSLRGLSGFESFSGTILGEIKTYIMNDAPAVVEEPFVTTMRDHYTQLWFQLNAVQFGANPERPVMSTWNSYTNRLLTETELGRFLNHPRFYEEVAESMELKGLAEKDKIVKVFSRLRNRMAWDGELGFIPERISTKVYEEQKASSDELNLLLVGTLRAAGLEAHPVIISTRKHGMTQRNYPISNQFNHLIAYVKTENEYVLLDLVDDFLLPGVLPFMDLNKRGFLLDPEDPRWIGIRPNASANTKVMVNASINEFQELEAKMTHSSKGYAAGSYRAEYYMAEEKVDFIKEELLEGIEDVEISDMDTENVDKLSEAFKVSVKLTSAENVQAIGDFLYLKPIVGTGYEENPLTLEKRTYPVNFGVPLDESYILMFSVPEGYEVESVPKPARVTLPEKGGSFTYQIMNMGSILQVSTQIKINQIEFGPSEYPYIKQFFDLVSAKFQEQIVLRKKS
ncbi:MAG: DUF3857 domain-containing protein [Bacteroidota bacterium]